MDRYIIDVREPFEFMIGHIKGAINMPSSKPVSDSGILKDISKNAEIILYCRLGSRSAAIANIMKSIGYTNVINGINMNNIRTKFNI